MGAAKKNGPPRLSVAVYFKGEPYLDWKNAYGAIEDAIWYETDRYVIPGKHQGFCWDSGRDEAKVIVELP